MNARVGQAPVIDDHPPTVVVHAGSDRVALDVNGIRLSFGVQPAERIREGIEKLAIALRRVM